MPRGLFHPGSGSTQLRLPEIYITLALVARLIVRGKPRRIGLPAGLWLAFAAWMLVGLLEGKLYHNPFSQDIYEAKDIIYIVGAYALAAGVPIRKYFDSGDLFKLGGLCVVCATVARSHADRPRQRQDQSAAPPAAGFRRRRRRDGGALPRDRPDVLPHTVGDPDPSGSGTCWR